MPANWRRYPPWGAIVSWTIVALVLWRLYIYQPATSVLPAEGLDTRVVRVVDGDTLLIEQGHRIRLLGVDTPETKHPNRPAEPWGAEASAFTRDLIEGREVRLEFDRERQDRYGRWLAYVFVDGVMLNELLIRQGYSRAEIRFPFRSDWQRLFQKAEQAAREEGLGIWSGESPVVATE